jgi:hypothetical protein
MPLLIDAASIPVHEALDIQQRDLRGGLEERGTVARGSGSAVPRGIPIAVNLDMDQAIAGVIAR